jgi:hypothetical protein
MTPNEELVRLRAIGRAKAAGLPDISPECARRIAAIMRESINRVVAENRPPTGPAMGVVA